MKRNKRIKGRFVTIVLGKYVIFSIALVILLTFAFLGTVRNVGKYDSVPNIKKVAKEFSRTAEKDYSTVDVEDLLGSGGYVQILDRDGKTTYSNSKLHNKDKYTKEELRYIADYNNFALATVEEFRNKQGKTEKVITLTIYSKNGKEVVDEVYAVDEELNVLYSTESKSKKKLTMREYKLLTSKQSPKYTISKADITDADGNERILLAYLPEDTRTKVEKAKEAFLMLLIEFVAVYCVLLFLFSLWVSARVKKPLNLLNKAMSDISTGNKVEVLEYEGPKEFVEIIDEFNSMSRALAQSEDTNRKLQDDKQKLIADISHDLKTPITVIKGYSKAICDGIVKTDDEAKYLDTIYQKSEELDQMINEFHEYTKLDHPENSLNLKPTDICEFTRSYFAKRYNEFDLSGYNLDVEIPEEGTMICLDQNMFRRVYDNVVSNFFKFNEKGKTFFCQVTVGGSSVEITLADNGPGIPMEIQNSIFEPFVVGERARNHNGSGLGLPIVKQIVEKHGGTISLIGNPAINSSTEFKIFIPIIKDCID